MTANSVEAGRDVDYVSQTRQRIARIRQAIVRLRQGVPEDPRQVIGQLEEQHLASQAAEFAGIAQLARGMAECLRVACEVHHSLPPGVPETILGVCQYIALHAEAVAAGMFSPSHHHARRLPTDACGAPQLPECTDDQARSSAEVFLRPCSRRPWTAAGEEAFPDAARFCGNCPPE